MSEWKEYKLGDIGEITSAKRIFYSEYVPVGVPFYRSKEIIDRYSKRKVVTELSSSEERFAEIKNNFGVPEKDDILLTSVGTLGVPYLVNHRDRFYFKDGNLTWFRNIDKKKADAQYFFIWLQSKIAKQKFDEITIGSTQPALTISGLKGIEIVLPSLSEQTAIAEVLNSLDDKIDLLHRQNKTFEQLAETLFRQWFMEEQKTEIKSETLGNVIKTTSGGTPSRSKMEYYSNGNIKWVKSKELSGSFIFETEEMITKDAMKNSSAKLLPANSILIAMYGATVGEFAILADEATCNQAICALIPNNNYPFTYLFLLIKTSKENLLNLAVGSAQQNISQLLIKELSVSGDIELIQKYHNQVEPYFHKLKSNSTQIHTLTQLRDALLPKLMSGEVRVKQ